MQRHRKKDRTERAPPTIQKYLHGTAGSPIGSNVPSPATNENLYQSCVGGNATKAAGLVCCRKDDLMFHTTPAPGPGSYPEDDPDCIEVYKEQQQQKTDEQRHNAGARTGDQPFSGKWCAPNVNQLAREVGNLHTPLGDALVHHHHHHQEQQQQQQQQLLSSCHPSILSAGSAEYSYAYCEPMLLQRPATTGDGTTDQQQQQQQQQLHTPVSTLSSSGSSYCVPVYAQRQQLQHHAPSLPLLQRPFRQPSTIRNPYQYTYGPAQGGADGGGTNTTTTTLHHHHHHHHHHSNYTLPNASAAFNATTTTTTTTRTGSLRALFSNIFRKSSAASAGPPSLSSAAHSAPFLELDGCGTLQRSSFGGGGSLLGAERHSFTTCYGTKENIYEDIGSQTGLGTVGAVESVTARDPSVAACGGGSSAAPPAPPPPPPLPPSGAGSPTVPALVGQDSVTAERRRVQVQHDRIIGELNLSVERLIMPSCDDESVQPRDQHARYQEYTELHEVHDCKQMVMGPKASFCLSAAGYDGANVAAGGGGGVGGGMAAPVGGLRLSSKRHFPASTSAAGSSSSPPPTLGVGSERHSPTVSYGKSYGDVDSGISSSSTSGTSYSSSILYRSITNYPQQQQHQQQQHHQQQHQTAHHHPQRSKHSLFNLHLGSSGSTGANRTTCCRGPKDQNIASRAEGFVGLAGGSANAVVTNAPDPPPPPDTSLLSYGCPTSDGTYGPLTRLPNTSVSSQTLTSCCFLSDHNLAERDIGSRPFAATFAYNHHHNHHQQQQRGGSSRANNANGSGNFWARFRKLRLPTGSGGKLFSASDRHVDTELHLEDFTGESMWPEPGPRPVYHHPLHAGPPPPHQLALLPLDAHRMPAPCALPPMTAPLNGNLPPPVSHQRTLHPFVAAPEPTGPPNRDANDGGGDGDDEDGSEPPQQRSSSPSTPSSVASTATSSGSSSSSSASPSSPMSPVSSSSCSSGATKHSGNERNVV